jgi:F-box and WD-40 domain protein MET30
MWSRIWDALCSSEGDPVDCISTLEGHTEGVICLNFDTTLIASGSVDATVKVWNFRTRECFTLRGHRDWVNAVLLWDSGSGQER